jgi:hypothetical protein
MLGLELESCMHVKYTFDINSQDLLQKNVEVFEELNSGNHLTLNSVSLRDTNKEDYKILYNSDGRQNKPTKCTILCIHIEFLMSSIYFELSGFILRETVISSIRYVLHASV